MSQTFRCDDKETLVAYLYGEVDPDGRREVDRHLRTCTACASETQALHAVRHDLESWLPPEADLGFTIAQRPPTVLKSSRWLAMSALPAWAQAAAAVLILATGAAIANIQVRYNDDGFQLTTGWMTPAATPRPESAQMPVQAAAGIAVPGDDWRPALTALEQDLRGELEQMKRTGASASVGLRNTESADAAAVLRRVQALVDASERRQQQELALRIAQVNRETDMKRQADLIRIGRDLGSLQGRAFATQANQQEVVNYLRLRRVSAQPVP